MDKVSPDHAFLDLSDYARPAARWLVKRLLHSPVTPIHITVSFTLVGLVAAALLAQSRWLPLAAGLLLVKSALDAADGALARARQRPSRVGRFLDSLCDFVVNLAVYAAIAVRAWSHSGQSGYFALALGALLCAMLQGSAFNYYYVRYRFQTGGDQTSRVDESVPDGYAWDHPAALRVLHAIYTVIYGWQDTLIASLDRRIAPADAPLRPAFLTAATALGLGSQLFVIAVCVGVGQPTWALWLFLTAFNVYALGLMLARRRTASGRR